MNKSDRREFLKKAGTGALGIGAVLTGLAGEDKVFARFLSRYAKQHVEELMKKISTAYINEDAETNLFGTFKNLQDLTAKNEETGRVVDSTIDYFESLRVETSDDRTGLLGMPKAVSDMIAGGFLAASERLSRGNMDMDELEAGALRLPDWTRSLEPGFMNDYAKTLQREIAGNKELEKLISAGTSQLEKVFNKIQGDEALMRSIICRINGHQVPCWLWGVVVVVVIVVLIVLK